MKRRLACAVCWSWGFRGIPKISPLSWKPCYVWGEVSSHKQTDMKQKYGDLIDRDSTMHYLWCLPRAYRLSGLNCTSVYKKNMPAGRIACMHEKDSEGAHGIQKSWSNPVPWWDWHWASWTAWHPGLLSTAKTKFIIRCLHVSRPCRPFMGNIPMARSRLQTPCPFPSFQNFLGLIFQRISSKSPSRTLVCNHAADLINSK